jgi:hypothetical protein
VTIARMLLTYALLFAGCTRPEDSGVIAVVGAKLDPGGGKPEIEYSVIVVKDGKFQAVGTQAATPVPKGAQITQGLGKLVEPATRGRVIEVGQPATFLLRDAYTLSVEMQMLDGAWVK